MGVFIDTGEGCGSVVFTSIFTPSDMQPIINFLINPMFFPSCYDYALNTPMVAQLLTMTSWQQVLPSNVGTSPFCQRTSAGTVNV